MEIASPSDPADCPECDGPLSTADRETVCEDCGLVVDEQRIDTAPSGRIGLTAVSRIVQSAPGRP